MTISNSFSSFGNNTLQVKQTQPLLSTSPNKFGNSSFSLGSLTSSSSFGGDQFNSNVLATSVGSSSTIITHTFHLEGCPW